ncbi:hypothetical protein LTS18_014671 [Coniosporium uncinatum]|uniref:Uncharacterized protein n=1 Tax=Coniosporium uncinatum TaxID=93489 RepID=A0ACC3D8W9_9PEZI|nr:hypothetical protein LTS18_014671 [Coniosporium uncinatum]
MLGFKAEIFVDPSNADAFIAALKPAADKAFAEPECTLFQAYQVDDEPGHFVLIENWTEDKEWLMTASLPNVTFAKQVTKPYYKPYLDATEPMFVKPRQITAFKVLDMGGSKM